MIKRTKLEILGDFMTGLNTMIDASGQLVHQFGNIKFMAMRDMLNLVKDGVVKEVSRMDRPNG